MAPAMKLTLKFEEGADKDRHMVIKLTLPRKWKEGPALKLKESFVEQYNAKFGEGTMELDKVHLINMAGHPLADSEIVFQSLNHGDHVRVKPGAPPERLAGGGPSASTDASTSAPIKVSPGGAGPVPQPVTKSKTAAATAVPTPQSSGGGLVTSAAALEAARATTKAFDYSKWDRLDLSDDDGDDCHPNIDKESWKRLMAQKRSDRRKKEEEKISAYKQKIEKYTKKAADIQARIDGGDDEAQLLVDVQDARESAEKYQAKLDHFLATRKLTADDLCDVSEDHTVVSESAALQPLIPEAVQSAALKSAPSSRAAPGPSAPRDEALEYDQYIKKYRKEVDQYAALRSDEASEAFLFQHTAVLHEHAEGYLLLLTLDKCMKHLTDKKEMGDKFTAKHERQYQEEELAVARQHLLIQFVLTLSKGKNCDPRDMIKPFFRKTSKQYEDRIEGFEDDLVAFVERIRKRAAEKIANGEPSPLSGPTHSGETTVGDEDGDYELADLGPGGLDPNEVLPTLPEEMQEAFISQNTDLLKSCLASLTEEEARYHMQRCIDSGLWRPGPDDPVEEDDDEEEEADEEQTGAGAGTSQ